MLLPGGLRLEDRDEILAAMGGPPWTSYELEDLRVHQLTASTALVIYGVSAERDGQSYSALISSTYVRRASGWHLAAHQQTPR